MFTLKLPLSSFFIQMNNNVNKIKMFIAFYQLNSLVVATSVIRSMNSCFLYSAASHLTGWLLLFYYTYIEIMS